MPRLLRGRGDFPGFTCNPGDNTHTLNNDVYTKLQTFMLPPPLPNIHLNTMRLRIAVCISASFM